MAVESRRMEMSRRLRIVDLMLDLLMLSRPERRRANYTESWRERQEVTLPEGAPVSITCVMASVFELGIGASTWESCFRLKNF